MLQDKELFSFIVGASILKWIKCLQYFDYNFKTDIDRKIKIE